MIRIISKIELIDGVIEYIQVGYTRNDQLIAQIEDMYSAFLSWIEQNKIDLESGSITLSSYFTEHGRCFSVRTISDSVEGLVELTNLNGL